MLSQKLMKKITFPDDKKLVLIRLLTIKDTNGMNLKISPQLLDKSYQYRKEDLKNKIMS